MKCGICLGPLSDSVTLHCHHSFCSNCIQHAIAIKAVCPLCSVSVVKRNIAASSARNGRIIQAVDEFVNAITSRSRYTTDEWQILHPAPPSQLRVVPTSHGNAVSSSSTSSSTEAAQQQRQSPPLEIAKDESHEVSASAVPAPAPATETQLQGVGEMAGDTVLSDEEKEQRMSLSHDRNEAGKQDDERIKANGSTDDEDMSGDVMDFDQDHLDMNIGGGGGGVGDGRGSSSSGIRGDNDSHPASEPGEQPMIHEESQQPAIPAESSIANANANANANAAAGTSASAGASAAAGAAAYASAGASAAAAAAAMAASADSTANYVGQNEVIGAQLVVREEGEGEEEKGRGNREEEKGEEKEEEEGMGEEKAGGQGMEEKEEEEECGEKEKEKAEQKKTEMKKQEEDEEKMSDDQMGEEEGDGKDDHQSPPPPLIFHQGDEVDVLPRCWIGSYIV